MSFDKIFDLTAGVYFNLNNVYKKRHTSGWYHSTCVIYRMLGLENRYVGLLLWFLCGTSTGMVCG